MPQLWPLLQIIMIDVVLAGDNAVVVGLAASRVNPAIRGKVIFWGIAAAVVLRILFAGITMQLLAIKGIMLAGGLLLFYVCWNMYRELRGGHEQEPHSLGAAATEEQEPKEATKFKEMSFWAAVTQITIADVSMSLDNVLAVAGAAKGNTIVLIIGLAIAIVLMAVAANYIAKLLATYPWISWLGLAVIVYVAAQMSWDGIHDLACLYVSPDVCNQGLISTLQTLIAGT
ncbi:MAG TPA: TerC family protein [Hyphomicrobiaceae bacterium]|nr:TerC family protein [Hyphomicrobiaceae bacterium]